MSENRGKGDNGKTTLRSGQSVLKTDDRIELIGVLDEMSSFIGVAKVLADDTQRKQLTHIQKVLQSLEQNVADPIKKEYRLEPKEIEKLERWIEEIGSETTDAVQGKSVQENSGQGEKMTPVKNSEEESAGNQTIDPNEAFEQASRLLSVRAVTRRGERQYRLVAQKYSADRNALIYMNRLSSYFAAAAQQMKQKAYSDPEEMQRQEIIRSILRSAELSM